MMLHRPARLSDTDREALVRVWTWLGAIALGLILGMLLGRFFYAHAPHDRILGLDVTLGHALFAVAGLIGTLGIGLTIDGRDRRWVPPGMVGVAMFLMSLSGANATWRHKTCAFMASHPTDVVQIEELGEACPSASWVQGIQSMGGVDTLVQVPGGAWELLQGLRARNNLQPSTMALMEVYVRAEAEGSTKAVAEQPLRTYEHELVADKEVGSFLEGMISAQMPQVWTTEFRQELENVLADHVPLVQGDRSLVHALLFSPRVEAMTP